MSAEMANEFFGKSQAALGAHEVFNPITSIKPVRAVYVDLDYLSVDSHRKLWIARTASAIPAGEALALAQSGENDLFRMIAIPRRRIVDLSAGSFTLNDGSPHRLDIDSDTEFNHEGWIRVTGKPIRTATERQAVEAAIHQKYGVYIGETVLALGSIAIEDEEEYSDDPAD